MYISNDHHTYYKGGDQYSSRGDFLILMTLKGAPLEDTCMRAVVRKVALHQFGQFMMGYARIGGKVITLSGTYGGDGLPIDVDSETFACGYPVPPELYWMWATGRGWNDAGNEAFNFRIWARQNMDVLTDKYGGLHEMCIDRLKYELPHGSGVNGDWVIEPTKRNPLRFLCHNIFCAMDEAGGYCHDYDFTVAYDYKPDTGRFEFVRLEFNDRLRACGYGLREYLEELFYDINLG